MAIATLSTILSAAAVVAGSPVVDAPVTVWTLLRLGNVAVPPAKPVAATLVLGKHHAVGGTVACNSVAGSRITWVSSRSGRQGRFLQHLGEYMPSTVMLCGDAVTTSIGGTFWQKMRSARSWSATPDRLTVRFADGSTAVLVRAAASTPGSIR
jgi:heat shock protein HslJ